MSIGILKDRNMTFVRECSIYRAIELCNVNFTKELGTIMMRKKREGPSKRRYNYIGVYRIAIVNTFSCSFAFSLA